MRTIGTDPEVFLRDEASGGVIPVCGLIGGTKGEPLPIDGIDAEGYGMQEDNVMLEFNVPPTSSPQSFSRSIGRALAALEDLIRVRSPGTVLDFAPYRAFRADQLTDPSAQQFGCSPEFDAYSGGTAVPPLHPRHLYREDGTAWRFAGGHVHIGWEDQMVPQHVAAHMCDLLIGLPSVALDKQGPRRKRYGMAGRFRPTPYGIEYRTLSNFWVFDDNLREEVGYRALCVAAMMEDADRTHQVFSEVPWADVRSAINNEVEDLAADLIAYARNDLGVDV